MTIATKSLNQVLFKNAEYTCVQVSPAASYFSYLQCKDKKTHLTLQARNTQKRNAIIITENRISEYWWSACEQHIIYTEDRTGQGSVLTHLDIKSQITNDIVSKKMLSQPKKK